MEIEPYYQDDRDLEKLIGNQSKDTFQSKVS